MDCSCELGSTVSGGSGTVTSVTASGPLSSSGGTTPNISLTGIVPVANGGTGASAFTAGSVIFSDGTNLAQDNANFFWNDTTNLLTTANLFSPSFVGDFNPDGVTTVRQSGNLFVWGTTRATRFSPANNVVVTGDIASGTNTILNVSAADIAKLAAAAAAFEISNANFAVGSSATSAVGSTITITTNATGTAVGASITFVGGNWAVRTENQTGTINSGQVVYRSGTTVTGNSGVTSIQSGNVSGAGNSGIVLSASGTVTTGTSGAYSARSGNASGAGGVSGTVDFSSGSTTTGTSGTVLVRTGNTSGGGTSGALQMGSGTSSGATGISLLASGASSAGGTTGSVDLFTGTTSGTRGAIRATASSFQLLSTTVVQPLRFYDTDSSNFVAFKAAGTVSSDVTWELPSADGTVGQVLRTSGAAVLSWVDNTGLPEVNVTKVANYTILSGDSIIFADTTGGAFTLTLPTPTALAGKIYRIYDSGGTLSTNNLSLAPSGAEKISGLAATKVFSTDWGGWEVTTNGTDWFVK